MKLPVKTSLRFRSMEIVEPANFWNHTPSCCLRDLRSPAHCSNSGESFARILLKLRMEISERKSFERTRKKLPVETWKIKRNTKVPLFVFFQSCTLDAKTLKGIGPWFRYKDDGPLCTGYTNLNISGQLGHLIGLCITLSPSGLLGFTHRLP